MMSIPAFLLETKRKTGDVFYQLKSFLWCSVVARCFFILQKLVPTRAKLPKVATTKGSSNLYRVAVVEQDSTNQWRPTGTQDDSSFIHLSSPNVQPCTEFLPLRLIIIARKPPASITMFPQPQSHNPSSQDFDGSRLT